MCNENQKIEEEQKKNYYFFVSLFNHIYWVLGSVIGALIGTIVNFNTEGIDFALTALFITIFVEQWLSSKKHFPAIIGVCVSVICLIIFGSEKFLIPTMIIILLLLGLYKEENND